MAQLNAENNKTISNEKAAPAPARRRVMWLMIAFSMSVVLSTVLLSNDMRHLKSLMVKLGYKQSVASTQPPPLFRKGRVFKPGIVKLLPRLVAAPELALTGVFLRTWRRDGRQYCDAVREAGIDVSEWEGSELFETGTYECSYERTWSDGPERRSVFYLVRGNSSGAISTIRAKLVNPQTTPNGELAPDAAASLASFVAGAGWTDLSEETAGSIARLHDVKFEAFGAVLSFFREPSSKASFNLILGASPATDLQTKTSAYFDKEKWLQLNDESRHTPSADDPNALGWPD